MPSEVEKGDTVDESMGNPSASLDAPTKCCTIDDDGIETVPTSHIPSQVQCWATSFKGHRNSINSLDSSTHDLHRIASGSDDKTVRLWDTRTGKSTKCIVQCFEDGVDSVCFSTEDPNLFFAASGSNVLAFDLRSDAVLLKTVYRNISSLIDKEVHCISFPPKSSTSPGHFLAVSDDAGDISFIDTHTWSIGRRLRGGHSSLVGALSYRPGNFQQLLSGGFDCGLHLWDTVAGRSVANTKLNQTSMVNPPFLQAVGWLGFEGENVPISMGKYACAACGDGAVRVFKGDTLKILAVSDPLQSHSGMATALCAYGSSIISGSTDKTLRGWKVVEGDEYAENAEGVSASMHSNKEKKKKKKHGGKGKSGGGNSTSGNSIDVGLRHVWTLAHSHKVNAIVYEKQLQCGVGNEVEGSAATAMDILKGKIYVGGVGSDVTQYIVE